MNCTSLQKFSEIENLHILWPLKKFQLALALKKKNHWNLNKVLSLKRLNWQIASRMEKAHKFTVCCTLSLMAINTQQWKNQNKACT